MVEWHKRLESNGVMKIIVFHRKFREKCSSKNLPKEFNLKVEPDKRIMIYEKLNSKEKYCFII